ncbi:phosphate acyltransferase [Thermotoga maritima MSB8]|uniref:Phosphate acyltransferase n=1 Tax=Thermotoga maritima (strain ATCC 43589 / DSM 3109 / JCM 10099 / NBRC 100826 / MSB8) TaxID=243274 RepID=PLSX_THEMA|nr:MULTISPECIES: phosphate acyltransferase PlsX [Thermotoga]Q9WXZ6.2 RecName: Full=Phosphate acyltransferase; AltName: Full=Acyl-ACP phosphotransacylase; AltName: Full=Acyl-[acyl-carrier-protein]--phosphate acyltransferase; AltName: Full=Phosphate-acyl-ACP acyltransferase [Thermotoga maritima MSB8]AGL49073.1 Phosphate:acyl-ACP acyltransferase PlsX [Thermotoga maritima MSB8]AHD18084.1 phosphate acyltransferase [Thermotoga maritima MSB8]AIY86356.1 putative phosphate acyltransferase [Thermotoga sp
MKIAIDVMGGDRAPDEILKGALLASKEVEGEIVLIGPEEIVKNKGLPFVSASEIVKMDDPPLEVLRKKNSSMHMGLKLLSEGKVDAFVSAGATGPLFLGATSIVGKLEGIERPALGVAVPSLKGATVLIDAGANAKVRPEHLVDFAFMGIAYSKVLGAENPRVGLLNMGSEENKGPDDIKRAYQLLKEFLGDTFFGNVEGHDINLGTVDVVVADGFSGNVALKTMEGTAKLVTSVLKESIKDGGFLSLLGALLMKRSFDKMKEKLDPRSYGGTFILGVKGIVVKAHGSSDAKAIKHAIKVAEKGIRVNIVQEIERGISHVRNSGDGR